MFLTDFLPEEAHFRDNYLFFRVCLTKHYKKAAETAASTSIADISIKPNKKDEKCPSEV